MARSSTQRAFKSIDRAGDDVVAALMDQVADLRKQVDRLGNKANDYGDDMLHDLQDNVTALAKEARHQGAVALRQANKQVHVASKAVQENPVPVLVALGTLALVSALVFRRD